MTKRQLRELTGVKSNFNKKVFHKDMSAGLFLPFYSDVILELTLIVQLYVRGRKWGLLDICTRR
jgi:hypothetical protein